MVSMSARTPAEIIESPQPPPPGVVPAPLPPSTSPSPLSCSPSSAPASLRENGFTVEQLLRFYQHYVAIGKIANRTTTGQVVHDIVLPQTSDPPRCFMQSDFMSKIGGAQCAKRLVSHSWNSLFVNTVLNIVQDATDWPCERFLSESIENGLKPYYYHRSGKLDSERLLNDMSALDLSKTYWLCIFALDELDKFPFGDPRYDIDKFTDMIKQMDALMVSLDLHMETFTRPSVVRDIGTALQLTPVTFRFAFGVSSETAERLDSGESLIPSVEVCDTTSSHDTERFLKKVRELQGGVASYDEFMNCILYLQLGLCNKLDLLSGYGLEVIEKTKVLEMNHSWRKAPRLGAMIALRKLKSLTTLQLDFHNCTGLAAVDDLAASFTALKALTSLNLNFDGCLRLTSVDKLGAHLLELESLRSLHMNFARCKNITSVDGLSKGVAELCHLSVLSLDFRDCKGLTRVKELGNVLVNLKALTSFSLDFSECTRLVSVDEFGEGLANQSSLRSLFVSCDSCYSLTSLGKLGSGLAELQSLHSLSINVRRCFDFTSVDEICKGVTKLKSLATLNMNLGSCKCLVSVDDLSKGLAELKTLTSLSMSLCSCRFLTSVTELGKALAELKALTSLAMDFDSCSYLASVDELGKGLAELTALTSLSMIFGGCRFLTSVDELGKGLVELKALTSLVMDFCDCHRLPVSLRKEFTSRMEALTAFEAMSDPVKFSEKVSKVSHTRCCRIA